MSSYLPVPVSCCCAFFKIHALEKCVLTEFFLYLNGSLLDMAFFFKLLILFFFYTFKFFIIGENIKLSV